MKKYVPYLLGGLALVILTLLVLLAPIRLSKTLDERVTLRLKDKIPYGTHVAYHLLAQVFPKAIISADNSAPEEWAENAANSGGQVVFLTARFFDPTIEELRQISSFIRKGNHVFIITNSFSYDAAEHFGVTGAEFLFSHLQEDSLRVRLKQRPFGGNKEYVYPGKKFDAHFVEMDPDRAFVLGTDDNGHSNFLQLQAGKGNLYIHLAPLAFSNYFILHKRNVAYFENALSIIPANVKKVTWNEYYLLERRKKSEDEPNILSVLWQYPSFKWALVTVLASLLLFTLIEMRRRQRLIPVFRKPVNDSLDFVRTLGRLYYDKGDHHNLAKKMGAYFLDEVRSRYHLSTQKLDAGFVKELHGKSGHDEQELQSIVLFMESLEQHTVISEGELAHFYQQLENFYQTIGNGRTTF